MPGAQLERPKDYGEHRARWKATIFLARRRNVLLCTANSAVRRDVCNDTCISGTKWPCYWLPRRKTFLQRPDCAQISSREPRTKGQKKDVCKNESFLVRKSVTFFVFKSLRWRRKRKYDRQLRSEQYFRINFSSYKVSQNVTLFTAWMKSWFFSLSRYDFI